MNYRNRKLLDLSHKVNNCQMQMPDICEIYSPEGCEPAHSNNQTDGKGTGIKSHDFTHVAACHSCHFEYDQGNRFNREQKRDFFERGFRSTLALYFLNKWVVVK